MPKLLKIAVAALLFLLVASVSNHAQELAVHCINIGHGDCTLIISPSGTTMMIDAGPPYMASKSHLCDYLDSLDIDTLDYFIATHYDYNQVGGIDTLLKDGIVIDTLYDRGWWYCMDFYRDTYDKIVEDFRHTVGDDQIIDLGGGAVARMVCVNGNGLLNEPYVDRDCDGGSNDENDFSIGLVVDYLDFEFFVGGDLPGYTDGGYRDIETSVAPEIGDIEVYQVNQHGSSHSTNPFFLETLNPEVSVLSVGNNATLPDPEVVARLLAVSTLYQTQDNDGNDIDGDIVITTAGTDWFYVNGEAHSIPPPPTPVYYHAFQNYDDDVDRIKNYYNVFGGDKGVYPDTMLLNLSCDTAGTISGYGRCLKIEYGPLNTWAMYAESFCHGCGDPTGFDLTDLFPDYIDPRFTGRSIDSIVFSCKLESTDTLTMKLELKDASDVGSAYYLDIFPDAEWKRYAVAPDQFIGGFDATRAKLLGFTFDNNAGNAGESGVLYLDDIYLAENGFEKPEFVDEREMLEYLNAVNFRHFWTAVDPLHGLALDRHTWENSISVDAIGFQLAAYVVGHRNEWVYPDDIEARVVDIMHTLLYSCPHADDSSDAKTSPTAYASVEGNWAHFLDYSTLCRANTDIEFSLYSNALLMAGVLLCQEYFGSNGNIYDMADSLYRMTNWNFLYRPDDSLMYLAWKPEDGFCDYYTDWFTEESDLSFLLAISTPETGHRIPTNPFMASGYNLPLCNDHLPDIDSYIYSAPGANFTYYFMQMYVRYPLDKADTVWRADNVRNALMADVHACTENYAVMDYPASIFGTTACEGPDSSGLDGTGEDISNYHAYGYQCRYDAANEANGTVAVYGSGAAVPFIPDEAVNCLSYYYNELDGLFRYKYGYNFWSPIFGFPDAFHLAPDSCADTCVNRLGFNGPWLSVPRFGIDIGPMLMNIDSYLSESVDENSIRDVFTFHPYININLSRFDPGVDVGEDHPDLLPQGFLAQNYPNPFNISTKIKYSLPGRSHVKVTVYDILGRTVDVIVDRTQTAGEHTVFWDGKDRFGREVASGVYFYRIEADGLKGSKKALLLK